MVAKLYYKRGGLYKAVAATYFKKNGVYQAIVGVAKKITGAYEEKPVLNLSFMGPPTLDPRITFTRADTRSCATYFGSDGLMKVQGANLLTYSANFSNVVWTPAGCTATYSDTNRVVLLIPSNGVSTVGNDSLGGISNNGSGTSALQYTYSIYAKNAGAGYLRIRESASTGGRVKISLTDGSQVGENGWTSGQFTVVTTNVGNGWWRVAVTRTPTTTLGLNWKAGIDVGNGVAGIYLWQPQLELGSTATTYSPTYGTATAGPRFDYDPTVPVGVTGGELAPTMDASWTRHVSVTVGTEAFVFTNTPTSANGAYKVVALAAGKTYKLTLTVSDYVSGTVAIWLGGQHTSAQVPNLSANGTISFNAKVETLYNGNLIIGTNSGTTTATVTGISVQEVTFAPKGLLIEESRANTITASNAFSNNGGASATTAVQNAVGVTGAVDAWTITEGASTLNQYGAVSIAAVSAGLVYTLSAFVKPGTATRCQIAVGSALSDVYANFNLSGAGSVYASGGASLVANSAGITALAGGWYRVYVTFTASAATGVAVVSHINSNTATRLPSYLGTGLTMFTYGMQIEVGAFPTSYIPTTTVAVTRAADNASMTGTNFSSWYNQAAGSFLAEASIPFPENGLFPTVCEVSDSTSANKANCFLAGTASNTQPGMNMMTASVSQVNTTAVTLTPYGVVSKAAWGIASNDCAIVSGGGAVTKDVLATLPSATQLKIGSSYIGGSLLNGHIRRISYYNTRLTDAQLQALTT